MNCQNFFANYRVRRFISEDIKKSRSNGSIEHSCSVFKYYMEMEMEMEMETDSSIHSTNRKLLESL